MYAKAQSVMQIRRKRRLAVAISIIVLAALATLPMAVQATVPSKPVAPILTPGNASLVVSWTAPSSSPAITDYGLQYKKSTDSSWTAFTSNVTITSPTTIGSLTNGTAYDVEVRASNDNGTNWSNWSDSATATPGTPHRPMKVSATAGYKKFTVTWSAPETGPVPTGYEIKINRKTTAGDGNSGYSGWGKYYSINNPSLSTKSHTFTAVNVLGCNNCNVEADRWHRFAIRAVNDHGGGPQYRDPVGDWWYTEVKTGVVTLTASSVEANSATLTLEHDGSAWWYKRSAPSPGHQNPCTSVSANTSKVDNVSIPFSNTNVTYKAYSNSSCTTELATTETFLTKPFKASKPNVGNGFGSGKLRLSLVYAGNGVLTWYYKYAKKAPSDTDFGSFTDDWTKIPSIDLDTTEPKAPKYTVTGLTNGTQYIFKVYAQNATGDGEESAPSDKNPVTGNTPLDEVIQAYNVEATSAEVELLNYPGTMRLKRTAPTTGACVGPTGSDSWELSNLSPNTHYIYTAYSDEDCSTELNNKTVSFLTKPGKAEKPQVTNGDGSGRLRLSFSSSGSGVLTWYYKYAKKAPSDTDFGSFTDDWTKIPSIDLDTTEPKAPKYTVTGLTNGTQYIFKVYAQNDTGDGKESDPSDKNPKSDPNSEVTDNTPLDEVMQAYDVEATSAKVEILNYSGTMRIKRTVPLPKGSCLAPIKENNWELDNLSSNTNYTYTAYSDTACLTELNNKSVSFLTKPGKPTTPTVTTGAGRGKLTISASVTGEGTLTKWQYQHKAASDTGFSTWNDISPYTSTSMTHTVTGLTDGESYEFKVRAWNASGSGAASDNSALTELVLLQPSAWLAHFGSAVSAGVTDMIADRIDQSATHGSNLTIAGQPVNLNDRSSNPSAGHHGTAFGQHHVGPLRVFDHHSQTEDDTTYRGMTASEIVASSSFSLNSSEGNADASADGSWTTWGGGRFSSFESGGDDKTDGDLTMAMVGTDYESEGLLLGLGLSHARGDGSYQDKDYQVEVDSTVTGVHPYLRYTVNDQLSVWGTVGFGDGELELKTPVDVERVGSDFRMKTGAVGVRQELESVNQTDLTLKSDYLVTRVDSNRTDAVYAVSVRTSRFRLMLGAARDYAMEGGIFRPSLDVVLREDRGDASVGTGVGVMGNFRFTYPARRLTLELDVQGLATHEDGDAEQWSVGGLVQIDPDRFGHGLSLSIRPSVGADIDSTGRVWETRKVSDLTDEDDADPAFSISTEVGYGMDALGGLLTLYTGLSDTEGENQVHRLGGRFSRGSRLSSSLEVFNDSDSNSGVALTGSVVW